MDWIRLHTSEDWQGFWASPEMTSIINHHTNLLLNMKFDSLAQRERIAGRLAILRELPKLVEQHAKKEQADRDAAQSGGAVLSDRHRFGLPQIV